MITCSLCTSNNTHIVNINLECPHSHTVTGTPKKLDVVGMYLNALCLDCGASFSINKVVEGTTAILIVNEMLGL